MSTFGKPLNPAVMAMRFIGPSRAYPMSVGKIYAATFADSYKGKQFLWITDDKGQRHSLNADRFEPVNPARRCLFKHLREKAVAA